jgi:hypothetical protein
MFLALATTDCDVLCFLDEMSKFVETQCHDQFSTKI